MSSTTSPAPGTPAFEAMTVRAFLDLLAARTPAPGGGAAASVVGAVAASLAAMVVNYSIGKKTLSEHQHTLQSAFDRLRRASALMMQLADEDAAAYGAVNELSRLADNDQRRAAELPAAQAAAVQIPLAVMAACVDLLLLFGELASITNRQLRSDLGIAGVLAAAACESSWWNVSVNAGFVTDDKQRAAWMTQADAMRDRAVLLGGQVEAACSAE